MMVGPIARRLGLAQDEEDLVHFLVEQHVVLSDASRSRDIHDPILLRELAANCLTQERLDLLYCLTYGDAKAVGEGVLSGWEEAILGELHGAISDQLRAQTGEGIGSRRERVVAALRASGLGADEVAAYLARLGGEYARQVRPEEAVTHLAMFADLGDEVCAFSLQGAHDGDGHVAVVCRDRSALLADISAALAGQSLAVSEVRTWATGDGLALVCCHIHSEIEQRRCDDPGLVSRLQRNIRAVLAGEVESAALLARRGQRLVGSQPADSGFDVIEVLIDQDNAEAATVVDVRVKDCPGLLHALCRVIADEGLTIAYASVSTYGDVARDAFYLTVDGGKLSARHCARLRTAITTMLKELSAET
jgi:[protein-PII] uridylyltransferase